MRDYSGGGRFARPGTGSSTARVLGSVVFDAGALLRLQHSICPMIIEQEHNDVNAHHLLPGCRLLGVAVMQVVAPAPQPPQLVPVPVLASPSPSPVLATSGAGELHTPTPPWPRRLPAVATATRHVTLTLVKCQVLGTVHTGVPPSGPLTTMPETIYWTQCCCRR